MPGDPLIRASGPARVDVPRLCRTTFADVANAAGGGRGPRRDVYRVADRRGRRTASGLRASRRRLGAAVERAAVEVLTTRTALRRLVLSDMGWPYVVLRLGVADADHTGSAHAPLLQRCSTTSRWARSRRAHQGRLRAGRRPAAVAFLKLIQPPGPMVTAPIPTRRRPLATAIATAVAAAQPRPPSTSWLMSTTGTNRTDPAWTTYAPTGRPRRWTAVTVGGSPVVTPLGARCATDSRPSAFMTAGPRCTAPCRAPRSPGR